MLHALISYASLLTWLFPFTPVFRDQSMRYLMSRFCSIIIVYLEATFAFSLMKLVGHARDNHLSGSMLNRVVWMNVDSG